MNIKSKDVYRDLVNNLKIPESQKVSSLGLLRNFINKSSAERKKKNGRGCKARGLIIRKIMFSLKTHKRKTLN